MQPRAGRLLLASPLIGDPNFHRTVILLLDHGEHGSAGVVLNRPIGESVVSLIPSLAGVVDSAAILSFGGPVEPNGVLGVTETTDGEVVPADLDEIDAALRLRIFMGYSGWGPGQLDAELGEHAWWVVDGGPADVFAPEPEGLWDVVVARQGGRVRYFANMPEDPSSN